VARAVVSATLPERDVRRVTHARAVSLPPIAEGKQCDHPEAGPQPSVGPTAKRLCACVQCAGDQR
jgi:hypothetical protein